MSSYDVAGVLTVLVWTALLSWACLSDDGGGR